jgi:hypothetical protein
MGLSRQNAAVIAAAHRVADLSCNRLIVQSKTMGSPIMGNISTQTPPLVRSVSAYVETCPWLEPSEEKEDWPFYLWDAHRTSTTSICEVEENAAYIVISHTWGRWLIKDSYAFIPGVHWLVPRNSLFPVETLPEILSRVPGSFRYIWFDLVCIPQDDSLRKQKEIAKQAKIFASAEKAAIWFNTVNSWEGLQATVDWLSLEYLKRNNAGGYEIASLLAKAAKEAARSTELVIPCSKNVDGDNRITFPSMNSRRHILEPIGWFTSLRTL